MFRQRVFSRHCEKPLLVVKAKHFLKSFIRRWF